METICLEYDIRLIRERNRTTSNLNLQGVKNKIDNIVIMLCLPSLIIA